MKKAIITIILLIIVLTVGVLFFNQKSSADSSTQTITESIEEVVEDMQGSHEDENDAVVNSIDAEIVFDGDDIEIDGDGVEVSGEQVIISSQGSYSFSGTTDNTQIVVDTEVEGTVQIVLNGVDITYDSGPAIYVKNSKKTVLVLADGTTNTISDSENYDGSDEELTAAIFSNDDLSIYGKGSLLVNGNYKDGISTDDGLVIGSTNITIDAVDDGIRGKDYVISEDSVITITSGGDGIKSTNDEDDTKGYVLISGGDISITSGADGISALTDIYIESGNFNIVTSTNTNSAKGIKADRDIVIDEGTFDIDSYDDSIHANGNITINGGSFTISSGDDGMHADETLTINGGTIEIAKCYEGIEAMDIVVNDGTIDITSDDDGFNGAGGGDSSGSTTGNFGRDNFGGTTGTITINGGDITITSALSGAGDGLDSNGALTITGGEILIINPSSYHDYTSVDASGTLSLADGCVRTLDPDGTYTEITEDNVPQGPGGMGMPGGRMR